MDLQIGDTRIIIDACKSHGVLRNQAAYVLATAFHESAHTVKPIYERGGRSYFDKYEPGTGIGRMLGNTQPGDGYLFRGRGYVQLTGRANYAKAAVKIGVDLIHLPDLALVSANAAQILVVGAIEGWFTGRKLADYITLSASDFVNARRIINGTDRADLIAGYAQQYDALLKAEGYGTAASPATPPASAAPVPVPQTPAPAPAAPVPPVREPQPLPKPSAKRAEAAGFIFLLAAAIAGFWHHITQFVSNLF